MLLQQIVQVLDWELEKMVRLREIVARLEGSSELLLAQVRDSAEAFMLQQASASRAETGASQPESGKANTPSPAENKPATRTPGGHKATAGGPRRRREQPARAAVTKRSRNKGDKQGALRSVIPAGPVVVSPAALANERDKRPRTRTEAEPVKPEPPVGSLGAMIKAMQLRAVS